MKTLKIIFALFFVISLHSCSDKETTSETTEESSTTIEENNTEIHLTLKTLEGGIKADYLVMAFDKEFKPKNNFNPSDAVLTETSDSNGKVTFDFQNQTLGTYYFEAFIKEANGNYILKSKYRTKLEVKKGSKVTSEIIVD